MYTLPYSSRGAFEGRTDTTQGGGELQHEAVASGVDDAATMRLGNAFDDGVQVCDLRDRPRLVCLRTRGEARHVKGDDGGEFAACVGQCVPFAGAAASGVAFSRFASISAARFSTSSTMWSTSRSLSIL